MGYEKIREEVFCQEVENELAQAAKKLYGKELRELDNVQTYNCVMKMTCDLTASTQRLSGDKKVYYISAEFLICFALCIVVAIIAGIFGIGNVKWLEAIGTIINVVLIIFIVPAIYGVEASIYRQLTEAPKAEDPKPEAPKAEAPKAEAPKAEEPVAEAPKAPKAPKAKKAKAE